MNTFDYDEEELALLKAMENQPLTSVPKLKKKIAQLKTSVKAKHLKRKSIHLKVLEDDLQRIKIKAIEEGVPYQALINLLIHKYAHGTIG
jgi:predicted DNA binding CopG/RHH family protein